MPSLEKLIRPKAKAAVIFDEEYLNQLSQDESACVNLQKCKKHLALHPKFLAYTKEAIKQDLNYFIGRFDKDLDGIVLGYRNITLVSKTGAINNDNPFIHIDVEAEFFVFKAKLGQVLSGIVNMVTEREVACLVHKTFTVSLSKPHLDEEWIGDQVEVGNEVLLRITFTKFDQRLPHIRGEFVSIISRETNNAGEIIYNHNAHGEFPSKRNKIEISNKYKKEKVNKHLEFKDENDEVDEIDTQEMLRAESHKRTSKRSKSLTNSNASVDDMTEHFDDVIKSRKKNERSYENAHNKQNPEKTIPRYSNNEENEDLSFEDQRKKLLQDSQMSLMANLDETQSEAPKKSKRKKSKSLSFEETLNSHEYSESEYKSKEENQNQSSDKASKKKKKGKHEYSLEEQRNGLLNDTMNKYMLNSSISNDGVEKTSKKSKKDFTNNDTLIYNSFENDGDTDFNNISKHSDVENNIKKSKKKHRSFDETVPNGQHFESKESENEDSSFDDQRKKLLQDSLMSLMPNPDETPKKSKRKKSKSLSFDDTLNSHEYSESEYKSKEENQSQSSDKASKKKKKAKHEDSLEEQRNGLLNNMTNKFMLNSSISYDGVEKTSKKSKKDFANNTSIYNSFENDGDTDFNNLSKHSDIENNNKKSKKHRHSNEIVQNGQHSGSKESKKEDSSFEDEKKKLLQDTLTKLMPNLDEDEDVNEKSKKRKRNASETESETPKKSKRKKSKSLSFEETFNSHEYSVSEFNNKEEDQSKSTDKMSKEKKKGKHEDSLEEQRNELMNDMMNKFMLNSSISNDSSLKKSKKNKKSSTKVEEFSNEKGKRERQNSSTSDSNSSNLFDTTDSRIKSKEELHRLSCNKKFNLPPDSDLENILNDISYKNEKEVEMGSSRKKRKSCSMTF